MSINNDVHARLRAMNESAERFAAHDPDVDWPGSSEHENPIDAICAALDRIREQVTALEREPRAFCQRLGEDVTVVRLAEIKDIPEAIKNIRFIIVGDREPGTFGPPPRLIAIDATKRSFGEQNVTIRLYDGTKPTSESGFIDGLTWAADELRRSR